MAAKPGEENVATMYGDIHYYYSDPLQKPPHHRFDKGSYVYLFENATERRARVEVANNAGTDDQDAFEGYLDKAHLHYSYKHHCLVSLTGPETADPSEWHLPTFDPRGEAKYHYKLHSLDIYFYTQPDALQFVSAARRVLPPAQIDVRDEPPPPPAASAVVRQLEEAAEEARDFTPMAYNPAAPAAPESIRAREKTPPPEDGGVNPLAAAVAYDQQPFPGGMPPPPPPPPSAGQQGQPGPGAPQFGGHPGLQRASTMPVHGGPPSAGAPYGGFQTPQHGTPPGAQGMPGPPAGGPAGYPYGQHQAYNVHQQLYRPQEGEQHAVRVQEQGGTRLERGVGGVLKKFEKRFG